MERLLAGVVEAPTPPAPGDGQGAVEMVGVVPARVEMAGDGQGQAGQADLAPSGEAAA